MHNSNLSFKIRFQASTSPPPHPEFCMNCTELSANISSCAKSLHQRKILLLPSVKSQTKPIPPCPIIYMFYASSRRPENKAGSCFTWYRTFLYDNSSKKWNKALHNPLPWTEHLGRWEFSRDCKAIVSKPSQSLWGPVKIFSIYGKNIF